MENNTKVIVTDGQDLAEKAGNAGDDALSRSLEQPQTEPQGWQYPEGFQYRHAPDHEGFASVQKQAYTGNDVCHRYERVDADGSRGKAHARQKGQGADAQQHHQTTADFFDVFRIHVHPPL